MKYIEEKRLHPINILIVFLIGIAAALFLIGSINSFGITGPLQNVLIAITAIVYAIALFAFLRPEKTKIPLIENEPEIIERIVKEPVVQTIEKPVIRYKNKIIKEQPKIEEKKIPVKEIKPIIIEKEKPKEKKSKYIGSSYNERYHLRSCRFAGAIKKQYLIEENDKKFFKLRGYDPCKVCKPDKN